MPGHVLADGMQQMRFAEPDAAIEKQRIVRFAGRLRDRQRGGMREVVVLADDEGVERIPRIKRQVLSRCGRSTLFFRRIKRPFALMTLASAARVKNWTHRRVGRPKLDLKTLPGGGADRVLDQAQIIVLEPQFAEVIRHFQADRAVGDLDRRESS